MPNNSNTDKHSSDESDMVSSRNPAPYNLTFDPRDGYLYAYVEGEHDSYEVSSSFWRNIAEEARRLGFERVLIDENIVENLSMADIFQLASELPSMGFGKVAFVDRYLEQQEVNEFGELVANNRGLNGKIFNDVNAAQAWLLSSNTL